MRYWNGVACVSRGCYAISGSDSYRILHLYRTLEVESVDVGLSTPGPDL